MTTGTDPKNTEAKFINIRASGLPYASDCWRRWAASMARDPHSNFLPVMQKHGFDLPITERQNIGATVGTACHEGIGAYLQAKIDKLNLGLDGAISMAKRKFRTLTEKDMPTDRETPNSDTAEAQIDRMIREILPHAETLNPKIIEFSLEIKLDTDYKLTGHADVYEHNGNIRDFKFGKNCSAYEPQLGAYRLMTRSHGLSCTGLFIDWLPRASLKKPQPPLQVIEYNTHTCENAAHHLVEESLQRLEKFDETGDPWAFTANSNSMLCSRKWCQAWGSPFCDLGRPERNKEDTE